MSHKQVIVIRKDLKMRRGKECAQAAHASMAAILDQCYKFDYKYVLPLDDRIRGWLQGRFKKICVTVDSEQELIDLYDKAISMGVIAALITDAGLTEFNGIPTKTTLAIGPDFEDKINEITSHLKLY